MEGSAVGAIDKLNLAKQNLAMIQTLTLFTTQNSLLTTNKFKPSLKDRLKPKLLMQGLVL